MKRFPIQQTGSVPWEAAEKAYTAYAARYGTGQSLERLAERGGFGLAEFAVLYGMAEGRRETGMFPREQENGREFERGNVARAIVRVCKVVDFEVAEER